MRTISSPSCLAAMLLVLATATLPAAAQETLVIRDVAVVDVRTGSIVPARTVVIRDGRIQSVEANGAVPAGARVIDGSGRYLLPGLQDMHVHLRHPLGPTLMKLFIANGVTGVREMGSDCDGPGTTCLAELRAWQAQVEAGTLVGPHLLALSSFPLNPPWDHEVTEAQIAALVEGFAEKRLDFIKTYFRLSPEAFGRLTAAAERHGIAVGGHIPLRMTAAAASEAGLRSLEHARDFLFDCFPGSAEFRASAMSQNPPVDVMRSMVDDHDVAQCDATFRTMARNGTWYVPTHVTRRMDAYADDSTFRADPRQRYLPADVWEDWQADADRMVALDPSPEGRRVMRGFYERGLEITRRAHDAGVPIALGTDAGDTYVFPGSAVHDELGELVKAGLTPAEALAAATLRAAEFLGLEQEYGTVEPGRRADLLLLNGDPLADIAHTRRIDAVLFRGELFDRARLDALLAEVEREVGRRDGG